MAFQAPLNVWRVLQEAMNNGADDGGDQPCSHSSRRSATGANMTSEQRVERYVCVFPLLWKELLLINQERETVAIPAGSIPSWCLSGFSFASKLRASKKLLRNPP